MHKGGIECAAVSSVKIRIILLADEYEPDHKVAASRIIFVRRIRGELTNLYYEFGAQVTDH